MNEHPGYVHIPDWQITAARHALQAAADLLLAGGTIPAQLARDIKTAIGYLHPYDTSRPEPADDIGGGRPCCGAPEHQPTVDLIGRGHPSWRTNGYGPMS
jgi:hypothetical protein